MPLLKLEAGIILNNSLMKALGGFINPCVTLSGDIPDPLGCVLVSPAPGDPAWVGVGLGDLPRSLPTLAALDSEIKGHL